MVADICTITICRPLRVPRRGGRPGRPTADGRTVAVAMYGALWRVDAETGVATELTRSPLSLSPAWSPDGRWIAHTADRDGKSVHLAMLDTATGESHRLTDDEGLYADPVFSPNGSRLAYVSTHPNGYFNIYVRSAYAPCATAAFGARRWHLPRTAIPASHGSTSVRTT
jgi:dipeptidyl aminopeptidase/acylaminoacyl peptidase